MSRIIKAHNVRSIEENGNVDPKEHDRRRPSRAASIFDSAEVIRSAIRRADKIVRSAEESATRLIVEAERRLDEMQTTAAARGFQEGYGQGLEEGRRDAYEQLAQERLAALDSLQAAKRELEQLRQDVILEAQSDVVKFAVLIAERIVRRELADPDCTLDIARSLLDEVEDESDITVYLPDGVIETNGDAQTADEKLSSGMHVRVETDPSLQLGDVRIETQWGWVDGRGAIRWKRLIGALEKGANGHVH